MSRHANRPTSVLRPKQIARSIAGVCRQVPKAPPIVAFLAYWDTLRYSQRLFFANFIVALFVAIIIALFHQSHWLVRLENSAMDWMMEINKGLPRMSSADAAQMVQFTFLDIDERSYRDWGEPYHVPRNKIIELVDFSARAGARLIVVDIDLSRDGTNAADDKKLAAFLSQYGQQEPGPPLILVRSFRSGESADRRWTDIRPSFLDDFKMPEAIHWAQPLFKVTAWDGVIRHWHLVKFGCLNENLVLVPATQLVATALLSGPNTPVSSQVADLNQVELQSCQSDAAGTASPQRPRESARMNAVETEIGQRLIYTIPWNNPAPDLITIPARVITESTGELSNDLMQDRIAIIGASFADSHDIHRTPIGEMPGALIIANAIKSLFLYGRVRSPTTWMLGIQVLGVILLGAWAFSRLTSLVAVSVASAIIIITLVPVSFYFFRYGILVNFGIPLLAMVIQQTVMDYRNSQVSARKDKHRDEKRTTG